MTEQGQVRYGSSTITYTVNRSSRRKKTVEITLDGHEGVIVAAPVATPAEDIAAIISKRADWILRKANGLSFNVYPRQFVSGETVLYMGRRVRIHLEETRRQRAEVRFRHWHFKVSAPAGVEGVVRHQAIRRAFLRWYKQRAKQQLSERVRRWSRLLGLRPTDVLIRDQRQRWASCAPNGTLRFNWRVVMAEPALIDYIVVHELAHLQFRNHSADFWTLVATAIPSYMSRRKRLEELGPFLQF